MNPETSPTGSRRKLLLAVAALAVLAAAAWGWRAWRGVEVATQPVQRRDLVQTVVASGRVQAPHRADIAAQITGAVVAVPVRQGQAVTAGQLLIELQAAEARALEKQAALAVTQAQVRLRQLREVQAPVAEQVLRQARATLDAARAAAARSEDLFRQGFIGSAALDEARKALEVAAAARESARKQWESGQPSGSDYALAEANLAQAEAGLDVARARLRYTRITAPRAGTLIDRNVEVGDVVQPGKTLMVLSPEGQTQLVVDLDERHLRRLALGQAALASADAFPGQRFAATLAYINPGVNAQTGSVQVKLDVPQPPPNLAQDMTVSVDIEIARRPQALVIGLDAVHEPDGPAPWVLKLQAGRAKQQAVRLGLKAGGVAEVLDGLQAGDTLVTGPEAVRDGQRVRARATPVR